MLLERLSRRDFFIAAGGIATGIALSRIAEEGGLVTRVLGNETTQSREPVQSLIIIESTFPTDRFSFSRAVTKYDLVPRVLPEFQWASDRMQVGIDYLKKLSNALQENPQYNSSTLGEIGAVSKDNFPISFSNSTTAREVIQSLLGDIEDKKVIIWGASVPNVPYLVGTYNLPQYQADKGMFMGSQIHANADFPFGAPRNEEAGTMYKQYTDLQVALKMIHEYAHCRQGQRLLELTLADLGKGMKEYTDTSFVGSQIEQKATRIITSMNNDSRIDRTKVEGVISFNEAQANQVAQFVLWTINKLNMGKRMPGTEDDSYPVSPNSLYQTFQRAIVKEKNPRDPQWLALHANWGKK